MGSDVPFILHILLIWSVSVYLLANCVNDSNLECVGGETAPCVPADEPHPVLSEYNLFQGPLKEMRPAAGVLPYDLNTLLFSDYAQKFRMIYVPRGSAVTIRDGGELYFPEGTVLVKNFFYDLDLRNTAAGRRIVETRLLIRRATGWETATYVWNETQDQAHLKQAGARQQIEWTGRQGDRRKVDYLIPSKNDCKSCHSRGNKLLPLGPEPANLNKIYHYADGPENQLARWERRGILWDKPATDSITPLPVWDDPSTGTLDERARSYLEVNCGHCHNPSGSARNSGLFLSFGQQDPYRLGLCKPPVAAGNGTGGRSHDIVPCRPDRSILVYRMETQKPAERMPEIGRTLVHEEGVALIKEWIESMECGMCDN
ncbi:MAG: SO2930 family diheme c-type cytochrome [Balneolaceae bacterium]|nr:SO2930 family diheme c-type cytochrome [Balneolaceae bacterium]